MYHPIDSVVGAEVTTIEAVSGTAAGRRIQTAWLTAQVPQCGYCQSGQIMSAAALIADNAHPTDEDIAAAMSDNICRRRRVVTGSCGRTATRSRYHGAVFHDAAKRMSKVLG